MSENIRMGFFFQNDDGSTEQIEMSEIMRHLPAGVTTFPVDPIKAARCALACKPRSGYAACLARCIALGEVCDGGVDNCTPL